MEDMSVVKKHSGFFYRGLVLALFLCALLIASSPAKVYAALPVYQCVGKNVYAETPGCTEKEFANGSKAFTFLRFALPAFEKAKTKGDVKGQSDQMAEIVEQLRILEYPAGADPIAAARQLLNQEVPKQEAAADKPLICDGFLANTFNPICWARTIAAVVGSLLMTVAAWALAIAGVLFNWSVMNAVILFKDVIFEPIKDGINIGWTAFRDISNIVIIGVFAFIAISIILGNKEFGQKKLVARVLVIAVLINFSLLFTKMIIDASNFTAGQFYAATQGDGKSLSQIIDAAKQPGIGGAATNQVANPNTGVDLFSGYAQEGIAGQFVRFLGVIDVADTYSALKNVGDTNNNGWIIIVHALFAFVLLLGAAIVLFYGSFLLISRAIILIFLLLTSAIAFASHLIPKMSDGQFGWSAWWKSLLGSAVLAPLLMIFLYITLQIASNLQAESGTLGNLISGSAKGGDVNALFAYLLVLGLLFGSFKLASSFSAKIGGFNFAAMATALPLSLGSRFAIAPLARNLFGRSAARKGLELDTEIEAERLKAAEARRDQRPYDYNKLYDLTKKKGRAETISKRDFNIMNTTAGKFTAKTLGLSGMLSGESKVGGFYASAEHTAKEAAKRAGQLELSPEQVRIVRESAERDSIRRGDREKRILEVRKETAKTEKETAEQQKKVVEISERQAEGAIRKEERVMGDIKTKHETMLKTIAEEIAKADAGSRPGLEQKHTSALGTRDAEIAAQQGRIDNARKSVDSAPAYQALQREARVHERTIKDTTSEISNLNKEIERVQSNVRIRARREGDRVIQSSVANAADVAERIAHRRLLNMPFVTFGEPAKNDFTAKLARKTFGKEHRTKGLKESLSVWRQLEKEEGAGGNGAPPSAPSPGSGKP